MWKTIASAMTCWVLLMVSLTCAVPPEQSPAAIEPAYPQAHLVGGNLAMELYLPDAAAGYYRGTRFDWSGIISRVTCDHHTYFGPFRIPHHPQGHDDILGTAEEFGMETPLGYDEAEGGKTFVKIGVGVLERPAGEMKYAFWNSYKIVRPGTWTVTHGTDWIQFEQSLAERGWDYSYIKRISISPDKPEFIIEHTLKNAGTKPIDTNVYCHNFTIIDDKPIGPGYRMVYPFPVKAKDPAPFAGIASLAGNEIRYDAAVPPHKGCFAELDGTKGLLEENTVKIENATTGGAVTITGDRAPEKVRVYAEATATCAESFVAIKIGAGEQFQWKNRYAFEANPPK